MGKYLKVAEIKYDLSVFLLIRSIFQTEHSWNKFREPQQLCDDGIATGNDPQDCLATEVVLSQEVQHPEDEQLRSVQTAG